MSSKYFIQWHKSNVMLSVNVIKRYLVNNHSKTMRRFYHILQSEIGWMSEINNTILLKRCQKCQYTLKIQTFKNVYILRFFFW